MPWVSNPVSSVRFRGPAPKFLMTFSKDAVVRVIKGVYKGNNGTVIFKYSCPSETYLIRLIQQETTYHFGVRYDLPIFANVLHDEIVTLNPKLIVML